MLCSTKPGLEVVASFTRAATALAWLAGAEVDIVILDLDLPDLAGPATLVEILGAGHRKVIILTGTTSGQLMRTCLDLGALAVVSKGDPAECALEAIDSVADGRSYVSPTAQRLISGEPSGTIHLPPRQLAILHLVAEGLSNKEIGYRLGIAAPTVSFHLAELRRRLGAESNRQLANRAFSAGLLINSAT